MSNKNYTVEELQQLLRMAQQREEEARKAQPPPVKEGSLVKYIDDRKMEHTALVLKIKPKGVLLLRVFRPARPNLDLEVGQGRWRR